MAAYEEEDDDDYFVIDAAYDDDGFAIAASSEEEDDDYIKVITTFVPPPPLLLPSSPSSSSPAPYLDADEEPIFEPLTPPPATHCVDDGEVHYFASLWDQARGLQQGDVTLDDAAPAAEEEQAPTPVDFFLHYRHQQMDYDYEIADEAEDDDDEVTDDEEDEDDYMYQGYYDIADRGRARHVKRSSGRRGRTKKKSTMGRPRGDVRVANCSVNL